MDARYNERGERIRFDGFRVFRTEDEEYLFYRVGLEELFKLMDAALEYACIESDYRRSRKRGRSFRDLCEMHRVLTLKAAADYIDDEDKKAGIGKGKFCFEPDSPEEMLEHIQKKYELQRLVEVREKRHERI